jgi:hypothetical protein
MNLQDLHGFGPVRMMSSYRRSGRVKDLNEMFVARIGNDVHELGEGWGVGECEGVGCNCGCRCELRSAKGCGHYSDLTHIRFIHPHPPCRIKVFISQNMLER